MAALQDNRRISLAVSFIVNQYCEQREV